jgi:hypothetical protein
MDFDAIAAIDAAQQAGDFYIDLLFYHLHLRCFVVLELKAVEFEPEHTGKLNFYLSAVDENLRHEQDNPTIGLLLCKTNNRVIAEYALRDVNKPIGAAEYQSFTQRGRHALRQAESVPLWREFGRVITTARAIAPAVAQIPHRHAAACAVTAAELSIHAVLA